MSVCEMTSQFIWNSSEGGRRNITQKWVVGFCLQQRSTYTRAAMLSTESGAAGDTKERLRGEFSRELTSSCTGQC